MSSKCAEHKERGAGRTAVLMLVRGAQVRKGSLQRFVEGALRLNLVGTRFCTDAHVAHASRACNSMWGFPWMNFYMGLHALVPSKDVSAMF